AAVGPGALVAHLKPGVFDRAAQLSFEIGRNVLAAVRKIAEILGKAVPLREKGVGQLEHLLEIAIQRDEARVGAEHRHAIAHVVEGDAQLRLALAKLLKQPGVLDRDHRLVRKGGSELDLPVRERLDARAGNEEYADQRVLPKQRNAEQRAVANDLLPLAIG